MFKVSKEKLQDILASGFTQDNQDSMVEFNSTKCFENSLKCNIEYGLSNDGVLWRRLEFGENRKQNQDCINTKKAVWIILFKRNSIIFFSLSIISMILTYLSTDGIYSNEWIESLVIFGLICLTFVTSVFQIKTDVEKQKQNQILDEQTKFVVVLRNGEIQSMMARNLVVGDIVILQETDKLYVDGLIVEQHNLYVDQSFLTGEQEPVHKVTLEQTTQSQQPISPQKHLVYAGSRVVQGCGKLLVLAVGSETQVNKIQISLQQEKQTPIAEEINKISHKMDTIGFVGVIIVMIILLARFYFQYNEQNINRYSIFANLVNLIIALKTGRAYQTIITHFQIQLHEAVQLMLYQSNLVRRLQKLENLAFMDTVVVDQTSILTQNRIIVHSVMNDTIEQISSSQFNLYPQEFQQAFIDSCFVNNYYDPNTNSGSRIEKALFEFSEKIQLNLSERLKQVTHKIPFSNAIQTIIINNNKVAVRGSAEHVLNSSSKFYSLKNGIVAIDDVLKNNIEQLIGEMYQEGMVMGIAYRDVELQNENVQELIENNQFEFDRNNLTLLGFLLFVDPLRVETKSAVQGLRQAGVKVILTTRNDSISAKNFAIKAGILLSNSTVREGNDFSERFNRKEENSKKEIEDIHVLSRARAQDKYNLVEELQYFGHVVGACCDCINDVPVLTKADVGYSLGIAGTEIARDASGIILLDDNINSVFKGLLVARNLIDSIKRIVQYLIMSYFALFIIEIVSAAIGELAISPLQIIWIHLFNDLFATFALSYCIPNSQLVHQKPTNKSGFIMDENVQIHSIILSVYIIAVCIMFVNQSLMVFNIYVMTTIFNLINSRKVYLEFNVFHGFFNSWISFIAILLIGVIQFVIVEYGGTVMDTFDGLSLQQWFVCIAIGIGSVVWRSIAILIIKSIMVNSQLYKQLKRDKGKLKVN